MSRSAGWNHERNLRREAKAAREEAMLIAFSNRCRAARLRSGFEPASMLLRARLPRRERSRRPITDPRKLTTSSAP